MGDLDDFLRKIDRIRQENPHMPSSNPEPKYECPKCKDTGFIYRTDEKGYEVACRCECYEIRRSREMMKRSGISGEFQKKTFDNFSTNGNGQLENAKNKAMQYVEHFGRRNMTDTILSCLPDRSVQGKHTLEQQSVGN